MAFLYPFLNFLQPGILWPDLADMRPMLVASLIALIFGLMRKSDYPRSEAFSNPIFGWFALFLFVQVISVYRNGMKAVSEEFAFWVVYLIFVSVSILLVSNTKNLRRYVWGMMAGSIFIIGYGIYGLYAWGGYLWLGTQPTGRAGAYGMYENHNDYSFIIIQVLPFIYMYLRSEKGFFKRSFLFVALIASIVGIFLSLSRGGMLALMLEFFLIVLLGMEGKRRLLLLPILLIGGIGAVTYQFAMRDENQSGHYSVEDSEYTRYELWRTARKMIEDRPLIGVGSGRFSEYSTDYNQEMSKGQRGKNAHNTYLEILAGTGFLGFIPFVMMSYRLFRAMRRKAVAQGPPWLEATRIAVIISFSAILVRAFLDAKVADWSFYVLVTIGLVCACLQRQLDSSTSAAGATPARGTKKPGTPPVLAPRPIPMGHAKRESV